MENKKYKDYNKIVEAMNNNYNSTYKNFNQKTLENSKEINKNENKEEMQNQSNLQLKNLISTFSNNNANIQNLIPLLNGNMNTSELLKNLSGSKNEMLMNLLMNMNKPNNAQNNKTTTEDFSNYKSIDEYDIF